MDVFIRNVPQPVGEGQLRKFFREKLRAFNCHAFEIEKFNKGSFARLSLPDAAVAQAFLARHGVPSYQRNAKPAIPLILYNQTLFCSKDKSAPDPYVILALQREDADMGSKASKNRGMNAKATHVTNFRVSQLHCGMWHRQGPGFTLKSCYQDARSGSLILGKKSLVIMLDASANKPQTMRIDIAFRVIDSCTLGTYDTASVTFSLELPPVVSRVEYQEQDLNERLENISPYPTSPQVLSSKTKRIRVSGLDENHAAAAGQCLVYRIKLSDPSQLDHLRQSLKQTGGLGCMTWPTSVRVSSQSVPKHMARLAQEFSKLPKLPFKVKFQLQRLALNAFLSPASVIGLLRPIQKLMSECGESAVAAAISAVSKSIPYVSPEVSPKDVSSETFLENARAYLSNPTFQTMAFTTEQHQHLGWVHRVYVTPLGMYLEGPQLETLNRVLRKYASYSHYFLRVTFCDENNDLVAQFPEPAELYQGKFKSVLENGIAIAGRRYMFLGFSHSSLKARQAWFMAPFVVQSQGRLIHAQHLIQDLGDFSTIRSPAKCAARIGQTFSDSTHTIRIRPDMIRKIPDIERNDRVFTDGCSTLSQGLLSKVWKELRKTRKRQASVLQIRFQGAKGVLSLDSSLSGDILCLRESMIKFEGSPDFDLEICSAAYVPLPMYLNRQLICLLEALGVNHEHFLRLQTKAVRQLEATSRSPVNAARFLDVSGASSSPLPTLLLCLNGLRLDFRRDTFLAKVVDLTLLVQLRDIKYRGRIPVENAYTLYGIADETGYLREGEIYVTIRRVNGEKVVLQGACLITRSPALHPGDIQIVKAVDVPVDSILKENHNCIVFSQHGYRDLPSCLSGGDLDGDLYNVIFEETLWPRRQFTPADYHRSTAIDVGHEVTSTDMQTFFIEFMENDKLGVIANAHLQCADQKQAGPCSQECVSMAEMHSTAVDFAKTGIPVDMQKMPRTYAKRAKPDFMAPSSRLLINKSSMSFAEAAHQSTISDVDEDAVSALDADRRPVRYYQSERILGKLFRAIDDEQFLETIQREGPPSPDGQPEVPLMEIVWDYVQRKTILLEWHQHRPLAREIRDTYNQCLVNKAYNFSPDNCRPLAELEVFTGIIVGKDGKLPNKRVRERSIDMKESFSRDIAWAIDMILKGDASQVDIYEDPVYEGADSSESLERSIAAFAIAMEDETTHVPKMGTLCSFNYVAAAACLGQLQRQFGILRPL